MSLLNVQSTAGIGVEFVPEAYPRRDKAVAAAAGIISIVDPVEQSAAVTALRLLKSISKEVEASRKAAKAPVLDLGKRVDGIAEKFIAPVAEQESRLTKLLNDFEVEQQRLRDEEARKAQAEADRVAAEERKNAEGLRAQRAEAERQLAAAREAASNAETKEELAASRKAVEEATRRVVDLGGQIEAREDAAIVAQSFPAAPAKPTATAPTGFVAQRPWTFEVLDLKAFAAAHPDLVEITVRRSAVLDLIRGGCRQLAHTRIFQDTRVSVRA